MFEEDKLRLRTNKRVTVNLLRVFPACHSSRLILKTMSFDSLYMRKLKPVERSGIRVDIRILVGGAEWTTLT